MTEGFLSEEEAKAIFMEGARSVMPEKQANWLTDLYVKWRTGVEAKASDKYRAAHGLKPFNRNVSAPASGEHPLTNNSLVQLAQNYSDYYAKGSLAKPKVYHDGKPVAK